MTELMSPVDEPSVSEARDSGLTYFAFAGRRNAQSHTPTSARVFPKARLGTLPELLAGRYRIERLLGVGGMGAVYRARDLLSEQFGNTDPCIALKTPNEELCNTPDASALLYSEFVLTQRLRHDNVLRLHSFEVDVECQRSFFTMELMRGLTLDNLLCERPLGLPWHELHKIVLPLLDALVHTHSRGIVHGDVKPSNVMLSEEGVRLFDFGLGQAEEGLLPGLSQLSRERINAWTPDYAAPEVLDGCPMTALADIYSVACLIYELAAGKHPFGPLPSKQACTDPLRRELQAPAHLPRHCWPALRTALSFRPMDRMITAAQLRDAFGIRSSWLRQLRTWA
jgi:serine/threonine-protein kinase Stk1